MKYSTYIVYCISGWIAVEQDESIPWNLERTSLQIRTVSTLGSDEHIYMWMYDKDSSFISNVRVKFSSPMQYGINYCTSSWTDLPVQPPVEVEKTWTITKTDTAIIMTCNNVEVLNYLFADSTGSQCVTRWAIDVEEIYFRTYDTASDYYRAGKGIKYIFNLVNNHLVQLHGF